MLLEFKMKNVFSYKDEVVFTLLAPSNKVKNRYSDNYVTICGYDILKTAVVVGENAGGKSNFIKGIQYFKSFFSETSKAIKSDRLSVFLAKMMNNLFLLLRQMVMLFFLTIYQYVDLV